MAFRTEDFKRVTRKSKGNVPPSVYPHTIKDKKEAAKLSRIIALWDAGVGHRRGDMDAGALSDFVGDPRLARGIVAVLGQWYRWRTLPVVEACGAASARLLLSQAGIAGAMDARRYTYAHVNAVHNGFVTEEDRARIFAAIAEPFGMDAAGWADLLELDSDNAQVLARLGRVPTPEDVRACYNFHATDTVLKRATSATLMGLAPHDAADLRVFAKHLGVTAKTGAADVSLSGGRLGRVLLVLLHEYATRQIGGWVDTNVGGKIMRMAVSTDTCRALGCTFKAAPTSISLRKRVEYVDALHVGLLKMRAQNGAPGWGFRRLPEAAAHAGGVFLPDFRLVRGDKSVWVTFGDAPAGEWDAPIVAVAASRRAPDAGSVLARASDSLLSLFSQGAQDIPLPVPAGVRDLCAKAALHGLVRVDEVQRALHVPDETRLPDWIARAGDERVRYVTGVGVVSRDLEDALSARAA